MELAFPEIVAPATNDRALAAAPAQLATLKETVLASFQPIKADMRVLADRYKDVALDLSTPKGLSAGKAIRLELREAGRYAVQRLQKRLKDEANDLKRVVDAEAAECIAIVSPVEDHVHAQIEAREAAIAEAKEREEARKKAHTDNIALIAGWAQRAHGQPVDKLAGAIAFVEGMDVSEQAFEEFAPAAEKAKADTLDKLRALHAQAVEAERIRAENEARQRTIAALSTISAHVAGGIGEGSERLARRLEAMKALLPAEAAEEVTAAYLTGHAHLDAMLEQAKSHEALQRELAAIRAAEEAAKPAPAPEPLPAVNPVLASTIDGDLDSNFAIPTEPAVDTGGTGISQADPAPAAPVDVATLKLGTVCERLGFTLTSAFIADTLGIAHSATDKAAKLYRESDFPLICTALRSHIDAVDALYAA